jgi:hypothetical protein
MIILKGYTDTKYEIRVSELTRPNFPQAETDPNTGYTNTSNTRMLPRRLAAGTGT